MLSAIPWALSFALAFLATHDHPAPKEAQDMPPAVQVEEQQPKQSAKSDNIRAAKPVEDVTVIIGDQEKNSTRDPKKPTTAQKHSGELLAKTSFQVDAANPFEVAVEIRAQNIRNSLSAFSKNPMKFQYADYELVMHYRNTQKILDLGKGLIHFPKISLTAKSYAAEGSHIWTITLNTTSDSSQFKEVHMQRDLLLLYQEDSGDCELQIDLSASPEARHRLQADTQFTVERTWDGQLNWSDPSSVYLETTADWNWSIAGIHRTETYIHRYTWNPQSHQFEANKPSLEYAIVKGDTLEKIGLYFLGSKTAWRALLEANPDLNPRNLKIGTRIQIPIK